MKPIFQENQVESEFGFLVKLHLKLDSIQIASYSDRNGSLLSLPDVGLWEGSEQERGNVGQIARSEEERQRWVRVPLENCYDWNDTYANRNSGQYLGE